MLESIARINCVLSHFLDYLKMEAGSSSETLLPVSYSSTLGLAHTSQYLTGHLIN